MRDKLKWLSIGLTLTLAGLGCGGDGGGEGGDGTSAPTVKRWTLSGTVAAGVGVLGTVTTKDSSTPPKTKTVDTTAGGSYTMDVTDMTPPFVLQAEGLVGGRAIKIHSVATADDRGGTVNITPLTEVITANVAGGSAEAFFAAPDASRITPTTLQAEEAALQFRLQEVVDTVLNASSGVDTEIDFLNDPFVTDHTGMDAILDVLDVEVATGTFVATITNTLNDQTITDDPTQTETDPLDETGTDVTVLDDAAAIRGVFGSFMGEFSTALPQESAISPYFDTANVLFDGYPWTDLVVFLTQEADTWVGISASAMAVQVNGGTAVLTADLEYSGNRELGTVWTFVKVGQDWLCSGNGRSMGIELAPTVYRNTRTGTVTAALEFEVHKNALGATRVELEGPGLSAPRVMSLDTMGEGWLSIATSELSPLPTGEATYTVKAYDGSNQLLNGPDGYEFYFAKTFDAAFVAGTGAPSITAPTESELGAYVSGPITVQWSLPAGLYPYQVELGSDTVDNIVEDETISGTSQTLDPAGETPTRVMFDAYDLYGRIYMVDLEASGLVPLLEVGFSYVQYRTYEDATRNGTRFWFDLNLDGAPIAETDIDTSSVGITALSGATVPEPAILFWRGDFLANDCSVTPCTAGNTITQTGFVGYALGALPADTYTVSASSVAGSMASVDLGYPGTVALPVVPASSMASTASGADIALSWTNPTTDPNWAQVDQLRIVVFDATGKEILYSQVDPSASQLTLTSTLLTQLAGLGDTSSMGWQVQTRAYTNGINTARGYSNQVAITDGTGLVITSAFIQYRTYENATKDGVRTWAASTLGGAPLSSTDIDVPASGLFDAGGTEYPASNGGFLDQTYYGYDCSGTPCTTSSVFRDTGYWGVRSASLAAGTYTFHVEAFDGSVTDFSVDYPGMVALPVVPSSTFSNTWSGSDLTLQWTNPGTDPDWGLVQQLRIVVFDATGSAILYARVGTSDEQLTLPASLLSQLASIGDTSSMTWQVQTRAYSGGVNTARGNSDMVAVTP